MKIWMFYLVPENENLDPLLYAFTKNPNIAEEFKMVRKGLRMVEKKATSDEYNDMMARMGETYDIVQMTLKTQINGRVTSVNTYATASEMMDFTLNMDTIATNYLGTRFPTDFPFEIFSEEIFNFLDEIGAIETTRLASNVPLNGMAIPWERTEDTGAARLWSGDYQIDELALFYKWREYTIVEREKV